MPRNAFALLILLGLPPAAAAQNAPDSRADPAVWRELEQGVFDQINLLRTNPALYADQVLASLRKTMTRYPEDAKLPFQGNKLIFDPADPDDHVLITEGGTKETTVAVLDEAIAALQASPRLAALRRDPVLDKAARFNSQEFATAGANARRTSTVWDAAPARGWPPLASRDACGKTGRRSRPD